MVEGSRLNFVSRLSEVPTRGEGTSPGRLGVSNRVLQHFTISVWHFIYFPWDSRNWPWWFSSGPMWAVAEKDQRAVFLTKPLRALVGHGDLWLGQNASWLPKFRVLLFCADVMNEGYKDLRIPLFLWHFLLPLSSAFKKTWLPWGEFLAWRGWSTSDKRMLSSFL